MKIVVLVFSLGYLIKIFSIDFFSWTLKKNPKLSESLSNYLNDKGLLYHWPHQDLETLPATEKYAEWLLPLSGQRKHKKKNDNRLYYSGHVR